MNIVLCGYHWAGCKALELLIAMGHNVYVYTHESPFHVPSLEEYCKKLNVPYSLENISKSTLLFEPDIICSIYYRYIIKKHIIDACKGKIFNLHPALLPNYRGCSSLTWAMIEGEKECGFTYHYINELVDDGNIIIQHPIKIEDFDTQETLYTRVMFKALERFIEAFNLVASGCAGIKQAGKGSYFPRGCPHEGVIDPTWDDEKIERFIHAMIYPPYPVAKFNNTEIYTINDYLKKKE